MQFICWSDTWLHRISVVARRHDCMTSWRLDDHSFKLTDRRRWFDSLGIHLRFTEIELDSCRPTILTKRSDRIATKAHAVGSTAKIIQYYVTSKNQYVYLLLYRYNFLSKESFLLGRFVPASQGNIDTIVANAKGISVSNFISSLGGYSVAPERWEGMGIFFLCFLLENRFQHVLTEEITMNIMAW